MSWTKGPWKIGTPPPNGEQTIGTMQGLMVAVATTGPGMPTQANARLIAAAPELAERLKIARSYMVEAINSHKGTASACAQMLAELDKVDAVLMKAGMPPWAASTA